MQKPKKNQLSSRQLLRHRTVVCSITYCHSSRKKPALLCRVACNGSRTPIGIDGVDQRAATVWIFSGEARCVDERLIERSCGVGRVTTDAEKQRNVETHRRRDDVYVGDIGWVRFLRHVGLHQEPAG